MCGFLKTKHLSFALQWDTKVLSSRKLPARVGRLSPAPHVAVHQAKKPTFQSISANDGFSVSAAHCHLQRGINA